MSKPASPVAEVKGLPLLQERLSARIRGSTTASVHAGGMSNLRDDANMALEGLKELSAPILNSGIPEALIVFTATYKLIESISHAAEDAERELSTRQS